MNTVIVQLSNLFKINRNRCYSFSFDFPIRYVNGCPESKTLSLKYQHLQLKSKHCHFFKKLFPAWKFGDDDATDICVTMACCSVIRISKVQTYRSYSQNTFLSFVKMYNCVWYLWTCPSQNTGPHNFGGQNWLRVFFGGKLAIVTFANVLRPMIVKCLNEKKPYRESS